VHLSTSEGFGLAVAEAQAAGIPVVVTPVGGVKDTVIDGETGYFVPRDDPNVARDRLSRLLTDAEMRKRMGYRAREHIKSHFSQEETSHLILRAYMDAAIAGRH
jgi:glycosyltransferase involved in cell wall biosynthesis